MKHILLYIVLVVAILGCDMKKNKDAQPSGFLKIYNENSYSNQYTPLDIEQTSDEGFLILSAAKIETSAFPGIYIMKIDKDGNVQHTQLLSDTYVSAASNLLRSGTEYYFVCMDRQNLGTYIMSVSASGEATESAFMNDIQYPLSAELNETNGQVLIQHYNKDDLKTVISSVTKTGVISATRSFSIGSGDFNVEQPVIDHLTGNGKKYPFLNGKLSSNVFYFNGFYNYTLSMCIFDFNWDKDDKPAAVQGYRDERCISSVLATGSNQIATSRYAYGSNYILPTATIPTSSNMFSANSDLNGFLIPELVYDAPMALKAMTINGRAMYVYASTTKSSQVLLMAYDASTKQLIGTTNVGATNPFAMANIIQTMDGGIAVLATTQVAGRFSRIAIFKIGKDELGW
ncbi:hypothetical protein [uncultured Cytophaga sp.]|uniref:hypothetical protein n=1 Tax=uncultured Cytophaga sp. TaxID=160238 RepID=UPI00260308B1|nr:hypothetical protein [uncultured Cytophaga sp.]